MREWLSWVVGFAFWCQIVCGCGGLQGALFGFWVWVGCEARVCGKHFESMDRVLLLRLVVRWKGWHLERGRGPEEGLQLEKVQSFEKEYAVWRGWWIS